VVVNRRFLPNECVKERYPLTKVLMGFPLLPKSVTLNDLERHNDRYFALFVIPNSADLGDNYAKVVEDKHTFATKKVVEII